MSHVKTYQTVSLRLYQRAALVWRENMSSHQTHILGTTHLLRLFWWMETIDDVQVSATSFSEAMMRDMHACGSVECLANQRDFGVSYFTQPQPMFRAAIECHLDLFWCFWFWKSMCWAVLRQVSAYPSLKRIHLRATIQWTMCVRLIHCILDAHRHRTWLWLWSSGRWCIVS